MSNDSAFPYPIPEYGAEAYWEACNEERLVMQRCAACAKFRWHPAPLCTFCGSDDFAWTDLSGRGRVKTWTVITHPIHPAAVSRVPYVVVEVELDEQAGLTMISNLVRCDHAAIDFDMALEVGFETHPTGQKLPVFRPLGA
ncbi:MAG: Zn-ribbon domain-containing OB-fold protein [Gammaproteobacteria bacterium]|jgi:uncharacterized OB-fold protein